MSIKIKIFSDFACPFCYVGSGIINALKRDFDIDDTWVPHELHPETPDEGRPVVEVVDPFDVDQVIMTCRKRGKPYGIEFGDIKLLSNTRLSLEAAEFARDNDRFHAFHQAVFRAYFAEGRNIGDMAVVLGIAEECGLGIGPLTVALETGRYTDRVRRGGDEARSLGVTAIPAFLIEERPVITGAVEESRFREILQSLTRQ